jgi:hypothetical protein
MTKPLFTNNANSVLTAGISSGSTAISLVAGAGALFPSPNPVNNEYFAITVEDTTLGSREIMYCTSRTGDVLTVVRGEEGTIAQSFLAGTTVSHRLTAGILSVLGTGGGGGGGNVSSSGIPATGQAAVWTDPTHIQGVTASLVAGSGINVTGTWPNQTIANTASGGNVSNSGTPTTGQAAIWTDATHLQGVTASLVAGSNIAVSGTWPNQTISGTAGGTGYTLTAQDPVTANAAGTFGAATSITGNLVVVGTVAVPGASVILIPATPPYIIFMWNVGANDMQVFAAGGTTIGGQAGTTGVSQKAGSLCIYTASASAVYRVAGFFI